MDTNQPNKHTKMLNDASEAFDYGLRKWNRGVYNWCGPKKGMTPRHPATTRFALQCELSAVSTGAEKVSEFLAGQGCSEQEVTACQLALVEACNNAIQYARPAERKFPVVVDAICGAEEIEIRVTDRTAGFDWPAQTSLPDFGSERGRGLFLIRKMTDWAEYRRGEQTNTLVMRKKRDALRH